MAEEEKDLYDEEDPEVPVDLFGMWGTSSIADDEEESVEENATDEPETVADESEPVAESEIADTQAVVAAETDTDAGADEAEAPLADEPPAEPELVADETETVIVEPEIAADEPTEATEPVIDALPAEESLAPTDENTPADTTNFAADATESAEASESVIADELPPAGIPATATELAVTDEPFDFAEPPAENNAPAGATDFATEKTEVAIDETAPANATESPADTTVFAETTELESTDITDDDLDDLIDVPILPLPVESTEVTDDDLADIHAPILSPGDPITIPSLTVPSAPNEQPAELSSPLLVEMVQEQDAAEALGGDLTATESDSSLALFKQLRDLAEELPHNVYVAFKASKMSAKLDEIIAELEG